MRNFNSDHVSLDSRMRCIFSDFSDSLRSEKEIRPQNPSLGKPNRADRLPESVSFKENKFKALLGYLALFHYVDDPLLKYYFQIDLELKLERNSQFYWLVVLLEDKNNFLSWLLKSSWISAESFFGNILTVKSLQKLWKSIRLNFEKQITPRRKVRHRGYRDHGTLPDFSSQVRRHEALVDFTTFLEQERQERELRTRLVNIHLLRNHLEEGRILTSDQLEFFRLERRSSHEQEGTETHTGTEN